MLNFVIVLLIVFCFSCKSEINEKTISESLMWLDSIYYVRINNSPYSEIQEDNNFYKKITKLEISSIYMENYSTSFHHKEPTPIYNSDLIHLEVFENLIQLKLRSEKIDDKAIHYLKNLMKLNFLDIKLTSISVDGYHKLKSQLPNCKIIYKVK